MRPRQHLIVEPELGHRLGDPDELVGGAQVAAELADDRVDVTVEDREPLAGVANRERVGARVLRDRLPVRREPILAERAGVADGIDLEEVLIGEPELDHPLGELERIGDPGVARPRVQGEQVPGQVTDLPVGVVGVLDHLDDVTDRALQQLHQLPRRRVLDRCLELGQDRPSRPRPRPALPVAEKPARAKAAIHLCAQLCQVACRPGGDQPHVTLDIAVTVDRRRHDLPQLIDRQSGDQLLDRASAPAPGYALPATVRFACLHARAPGYGSSRAVQPSSWNGTSGCEQLLARSDPLAKAGLEVRRDPSQQARVCAEQDDAVRAHDQPCCLDLPRPLPPAAEVDRARLRVIGPRERPAVRQRLAQALPRVVVLEHRRARPRRPRSTT